jgi:hypothetical protein
VDHPPFGDLCPVADMRLCKPCVTCLENGQTGIFLIVLLAKRLPSRETRIMKRANRRGVSPTAPHRREVTMTAKRDVEAHFRKWHIGEEATIDHLVRSLAPEEPHVDNRIHDAVTESGLCVEDQVRKTWNNPIVGLAIF